MAEKKFNLKSKHKSKKGGLTDKARLAYNRATGSNLKRPQPEGGSRKKSYCARSKGQMNDHNIDCSKTPDKRICLARRRWKCNKSLQKSDMPPKAKLAAFLREHLDNKLALKEAEPTITKSNELPGGKGDAKDIADFDSKQVQMGLKVELEHTDNLEVAKEIVADHLSEDPAYYSKLKGSGLADELNKAGRCWEGYEPTPGKKPYSKGSCRKIKKSDSEASLKLINQFEGSSINPAEYHYAVHKNGNEIGRAIVFDKDPKSIHSAGKKGASLKDIRLKSEHQGRGLSGHIINQLVNTHGPLASDSRGNISEAGAKMFAKYGTKQLDNSYVLGGDMKKSAKENLIKALACKGEKLSKSISAMAIESGEYQGETLDSHHHNRIGQEYRGMAKQAFTEGKKVKAREYHEKALKHFQKADKMGFQAEEPLEKKISDKLRTLGVGAAAALGSIVTPTQTSTFADKPPATERKLVEEPKPTTDAHKIISMIESSGGKNIVHRFLKKQGQRAVSQYGLLPSRVIELYARSPNFRSSPTGKMIGDIVEGSISKHKSGNFYDTAAFMKQTPMADKQSMFQKINQITAQKEHDDVIFQADREHSLKNLSAATKDPTELDIMATHSHHWHWPRTKRLYEQGGIGAVVNDEKSKEGNYIKKYHKNLPEGSLIKQKIQQFLSIPKKLMKLKKKDAFHGS